MIRLTSKEIAEPFIKSFSSSILNVIIHRDYNNQITIEIIIRNSKIPVKFKYDIYYTIEYGDGYIFKEIWDYFNPELEQKTNQKSCSYCERKYLDNTICYGCGAPL